MLNYNPQGLIPAVIQDDETGALLMLGYMTPETIEMTKQKGQVVFWSRSRKEIWHKGATSGDFLEVRSMKADCEMNSLLITSRWSAAPSVTPARRAASFASSTNSTSFAAHSSWRSNQKTASTNVTAAISSDARGTVSV